MLDAQPYWFGVDAKGQRLPYLDELVYVIVPDQNTAALKFQAGEIDALDNVKPEDYKTYAETSAEAGNYTLHDLGPVADHELLLVQPEQGARGRSPARSVGDPYVEPVKYAWFSEPGRSGARSRWRSTVTR